MLVGFNQISLRILLFYVGSLAIIMSIQPWHTVNPAESPFVSVFAAIGILGAASIVNFVVLSSALSAGNSAIFSTRRMLYGLAIHKHAPKSFSRLSARKTPSNALFFSTLVIGLSVILNYIIPAGAFLLVSGIATIYFIFIWAILLICHLKYLKEKPLRPKHRLYSAPYTNYVTLIFLFNVRIILLFLPEIRWALLISPTWFISLWLIYHYKYQKNINKRKD